MNLCVDIGNTRIKAMIFEKDSPKEMFSWEDGDLFLFEQWIKRLDNIEGCIVSSVKSEDFFDFFQLKFKSKFFVRLTTKTPIPFENLYESQSTLGTDRIALVAGACSLYPKRNILVISLGTTITYEYIVAGNQYLGGNISPGVETRFKSLHQNTDKLPLIHSSCKWPVTGHDTTSAISSGVLQGILYEIEGYINQFAQSYKDGVVLMTGGNADLFVDKCQYPIILIEKLSLIGLCTILKHNQQQ